MDKTDIQDHCSPSSSRSGRVHMNSSYIPRNALNCLPDCTCHCHHPAVVQLIPDWLEPYVGQVAVSRRLLHPAFSSWSLCNEQTCRGDLRNAMTLQWKSWLLHGYLQYVSKDRRIHFSIGAPRVISWGSPIIKAIFRGDLQSVRSLFATGQASIWDHAASGVSVFRVSEILARFCLRLTTLRLCSMHVSAGKTTPTKNISRSFPCLSMRAQMPSYLKSKPTFSYDANPLNIGLYCRTHMIYSAHDILALGLFRYLLDKSSDRGRSLATIVRTNAAAISIFRSLFNIDAMDALEDYLDRYRSKRADISGLLASLADAECNSISRPAVFDVIGYTPLEYAAQVSPGSVLSLLEDGEDATRGPILVYATGNGMSSLMKPLLDAGADVNMTDSWGYTALLEACSLCCYQDFAELHRWAEDIIDWDVRAPDGRNALDLFESGVMDGMATDLTQSQIDEFRAILVAHVHSVEGSDGRLDMPGSFPDAK